MFFGRNKFSRPNGRLSPIACHTFLESYDTQLKSGLAGNHFGGSYKASDFCWQTILDFPQHLRMTRIMLGYLQDRGWEDEEYKFFAVILFLDFVLSHNFLKLIITYFVHVQKAAGGKTKNRLLLLSMLRSKNSKLFHQKR